MLTEYNSADIEETKHLYLKDTEKDIFLLNIEGKNITFILDTIKTSGACSKFKSKVFFLNDIEDCLVR